MEESEKRRERLRAMRMEASTELVSSSSTLNPAVPPPLANPLLQNEDSNKSSTTASPHRFDYYTDPIAAYSSVKNRSSTPKPHFLLSPHGSMNPELPRPGAHPLQNNYAPHPGMYQGGDPYCSPGRPGPIPSLMGIRSPYPVHQGSQNLSTTPGRGQWFNNNPSPGPGCGGSPYPVYQGSPDFRSPPQGRGQWSNNSPAPGLGRGGGASSGQWSNNSPGPQRGGGPSPSVGRGRGWWDGSRMSSSTGYSGGRGRGRGRGYVQAGSFYSKSMVEDPWESLTPVIWQGGKENDQRSFTNRRGFVQKTPTFCKTPSAKKARVSDPFDVSNSKKSLAEFLSESFEEAVEDTATV